MDLETWVRLGEEGRSVKLWGLVEAFWQLRLWGVESLGGSGLGTEVGRVMLWGVWL